MQLPDHPGLAQVCICQRGHAWSAACAAACMRRTCTCIDRISPQARDCPPFFPPFLFPHQQHAAAGSCKTDMPSWCHTVVVDTSPESTAARSAAATWSTDALKHCMHLHLQTAGTASRVGGGEARAESHHMYLKTTLTGYEEALSRPKEAILKCIWDGGTASTTCTAACRQHEHA